MIKPSQVLRLLRINQVLMKHGLDEMVLATHLFRPVRFLGLLLPWNWFKRNAKGVEVSGFDLLLRSLAQAL